MVTAIGRQDRPAWARRSMAVLILLTCFGVGLWAGVVVIEPSSDPQPEPTVPVYTVREGNLGAAATFTAHLGRAEHETLAAPQGGVITHLDDPIENPLQAGQIAYRMDLEPVVLLPGVVPGFRDLTPGTAGEDVLQLQEFLADEGGFDVEVTGQFDAATTHAVHAWQEDLNLEPTGSIERGRVIFAEPDAQVFPLPDLGVGRTLSAGEPVLGIVHGDPSATLRVDGRQAGSFEPSATVGIQVGGITVTGVLGDQKVEDDGAVSISITAPDGGAVCVADCARALDPSGMTQYQAEVVTVPETTGPQVPLSAIRTDPGGVTVITTAEGEEREVEVLASHAGLAIIEGVDEGTTIRVFGEQ